MVVDVAVIFLFSTIAPLLSYIIKVVASLELNLSSVNKFNDILQEKLKVKEAENLSINNKYEDEKSINMTLLKAKSEDKGKLEK